MPEETDRPQDVGRRHRAAANAPTPETARILELYRAAMRAELGDVLEELRPAVPEPGTPPTFGELIPLRPALAERLKLWDLAIKLGRELASPGLAGLEDPDPPAPSTSSSRPAPARAPRLSARERRSLGG